MSPNLQTTAVVFDLGEVLVDLDPGRLWEFLRSQGLRLRDMPALAAAVRFDLYETGKLSDAEFHQRVLALTSEVFSFDDWARVWTGMLSPSARMLDLADRIARRHPVFILTNTNRLHYRYIERRLSLNGRYSGVVTSFDAGVMKPDPRIYALAEEQFGVNGANILFFDDREANVRGALQAGWQGRLFERYDTTVAALEAAGVAVG